MKKAFSWFLTIGIIAIAIFCLYYSINTFISHSKNLQAKLDRENFTVTEKNYTPSCLWSQIESDSTIKFYDRGTILYANWEYESEEEFSKSLLDSGLHVFFKDLNWFLSIESLEDSLSNFLSLINNETHVNKSLFDFLPLDKQKELSRYIAKGITKKRICPIFIHFYLIEDEYQFSPD